MRTRSFAFLLIFVIAILSACRSVPDQAVEVSPQVSKTTPMPQTVEVTRMVAQTSASPTDPDTTVTSLPQTTLDPTTLAPDLAAELKIFPLYPGARWVYTETTYTQTGDPNQIISAVASIEDQVADVQNLPPYYIAHIQREVSLVSADPGFLEYNGTKTSLGHPNSGTSFTLDGFI